MAYRLYYGQVLAGMVIDPFYSDETWYGEFGQTASPEPGLAETLCEFIAFCKRWHVRLDANEKPDASEFDQQFPATQNNREDGG
jgi:hypothetical protein